MNVLSSLLKLRPAGNTVDEISAAWERTRTAAEEATEAVKAALASRDALLLDGTADQLKAAEAGLREARESVERVGALEAALTARLATARREAIETHARETTEAHEAADRALVEWWDKALPKLRALAAEGTKLTMAHGETFQQWQVGVTHAAQQNAPAGYGPPLPKTAAGDHASARRFLTVAGDLLRMADERAASP